MKTKYNNTDYAEGRREWWINGKLRRVDGPAIEHTDGRREWWVYGKLRRIAGPGIEYPDGRREWWVCGKLHRQDGPAVEHADGRIEWWVQGKLHRIDGPVVEYADSRREWRINGKLHCQPAIEHAGGRREWWVYGELLLSDCEMLCIGAEPAKMKTEEFDYRNNGEEAVEYNNTDTVRYPWGTLILKQTKPDHEIQASPNGARLIILQSKYPYEIDRDTARRLAERLNQWAETLSLRLPHDA